MSPQRATPGGRVGAGRPAVVGPTAGSDRTTRPPRTAGPARVTATAPRMAARATAARTDLRRRRLRWAGRAVLVLGPLALALWVLGGSPLLALQHVTVLGGSRASAQQVEAAIGVPVGTPLARIDTAAVARRVARLGPVAHVRVSRAWPHGLRIVIVERVAVAAVADGSGVQLLDAQGVVIGPAAKLPRGLVSLHVPSAGDPGARAALTVLRALPPFLEQQLAAVAATGPDHVQLLLRGGRRVAWGPPGSPAQDRQKAEAVVALLRLPGRDLDVSAPGVATRR